ncbi:MAG: hypothetical protein QXZ11_09380 [Thermoproteota archaeon]
MLKDCKNVGEGFGADERSFIFHHLTACGSQLKVLSEKLAGYNENIRQHLERINRGRTKKITLRYFQHLAALHPEIVLDRLFNSKEQLLTELLNAFVDEHDSKLLPGKFPYDRLTEQDITKLAF